MNAAAPPSQLSELLARRGAPVVAVEDGRIVGIGHSHKLGRYVVLRDTYGDLFTYAGLGSIAPDYRLPKPVQVQVPKGALQSGESAERPDAKAHRKLRTPAAGHAARRQEEDGHLGKDRERGVVRLQPKRRKRRSRRARFACSPIQTTQMRPRPRAFWQRVRQVPRLPPMV